MSLPARNPRLLDLDSLKKLIAEGAVETVRFEPVGSTPSTAIAV